MNQNTDSLYVDQLILKALRSGEDKALNNLFSSYYNKLFRAGLRWCSDSALTEDCIQLVFLDLWKYKMSISEINSFEAYLMGSLKKRIAKELSRKENKNIQIGQVSEDKLLSTNSYEEIFIQQETDESQKINLKAAMNQLTPRQKEILTLRYFEEESFKNISIKTGLQVDSIYKTLHEAIRKLKIILVK